MKLDAKYNIMKGFLNLQQAQCKNKTCKVRKCWKQINKIEHMLQISEYMCDKPIIDRSQKDKEILTFDINNVYWGYICRVATEEICWKQNSQQ